jgi:hypothetical protein
LRANQRLALLLLCCAVSVLYGQSIVLPPTITIPSAPGTARFTVNNPFDDCTMSIAVSNADPTVATISPSGIVTPPTGANQIFTITALKPGITTITVTITGNPPRCAFGNDTIIVGVGGGGPSVLPTEQQVVFTGFDGDPVSTATGELYDAGLPPDLSLGGPLPLQFSRYYASLLGANGFVTLIGNNWMHNFEDKLVTSASSATVSLFGGKKIAFQASGNNWQLTNPDLVGYQLANGPGTNRQFMDPASNLIYTFDASGVLIKIEDRNGNALTVAPPVVWGAQSLLPTAQTKNWRRCRTRPADPYRLLIPVTI